MECVKSKEGIIVQANALAGVEIDMLLTSVVIMRVDSGAALSMPAGGHVSCFELFGTDQIRSIRDLKGKTVAVVELG